MFSPINIQRRYTFCADKISFVRVTAPTQSVQTQAEEQAVTVKDPQGVFPQGDYLKCVPITADQFQAAYHSSDYKNNLRDIYFEVTMIREADEQLAVELFQAFGPLIAVKFKNRVFTRRGL